MQVSQLDSFTEIVIPSAHTSVLSFSFTVPSSSSGAFHRSVPPEEAVVVDILAIVWRDIPKSVRRGRIVGDSRTLSWILEVDGRVI